MLGESAGAARPEHGPLLSHEYNHSTNSNSNNSNNNNNNNDNNHDNNEGPARLRLRPQSGPRFQGPVSLAGIPCEGRQ